MSALTGNGTDVNSVGTIGSVVSNIASTPKKQGAVGLRILDLVLDRVMITTPKTCQTDNMSAKQHTES